MIRKATIEDLSVMLGISQRSFETAWSATSFQAEFYKQHSYIYMYAVQNLTVAFLIIWDLDKEGEIVSLAVDKGWRNRGIGSALLKHVITAHSNIKVWHLEVAPNNKAAISLYEKNAFKRQRIIKNYYGHGRDAIQMNRYN